MPESGEDEIEKIATFYDYLEIQPRCNNMFMVREKKLENITDIENINKQILALGEKIRQNCCGNL